MKKRVSLLLLMFFAVTTMMAESIYEGQARAIAANFLATRAMPSTNQKMAHTAQLRTSTAGDAKAAYYVYNATNGGYVIVAGDNRAPAVLGYSDKGAFDLQDIPEAMQELLENYTAQIEILASQGFKADTHFTSRSPIQPLVKATFSQNSPYNTKLPFVNGKHAYVGCVATAMAQIMHYWKHPATTTTVIPAYTTEDLNIYMPALPVTSFNWNVMQDSYLTSDSLSVAGMAAAQLSLYCAQSVQMSFKKNSSSASSRDIVAAIINYFGYKPNASYRQRKYYNTQQWEEMIYNELAAKRPVIYRGSKDSGGHAFVCDGYDGYGLFHINWGWNGSSNGYFLLNLLNPDQQGTGGIDGTYGYIIDQAIITGIEPGTVASQDTQITVRQLEVQNYSRSRNSTNQDFTATILTHFLNTTSSTQAFDYGWGLYMDNNLVKPIYSGHHSGLSPNYYTYLTEDIAFGSGLASGNYRLVAIFRPNSTSDWQPCLGSEVNYALVTISGNSCTITNYGTNSTPNYQVNNVNISGHMHPNRPVYIDMNLTNLGNTRNDIIYMFADGQLAAAGFIDVEKGNSDVVKFEYMSAVPGYFTLSFSLNDNGSNPLATRTIAINAMPSANLTGTATVLNVTDPQNRIITSDKYSVVITVTNNNSTTYNEDITIKLYKNTYGNYGTNVQTISKNLVLGPNQRTTIQFDLDNVIDGWNYFTKSYYYSQGEAVSLAGTSFHTIIFPSQPPFINGDVNNDGEVNISDINALTDYILTGNGSNINLQAADCNKDGEINISDINALINIILD